ncbi:MAG: phosphoenolpyruvate--protein phosphotransferase [Kiritimatiellae bacterium]|nr:phosphoenolpyruvate--protein phosphotransferase [Kiritimatiellia bacterium]
MAESAGEVELHGVGVSPGVVIGPAFLLTPADVHVVERAISADEVPREIVRLEEALITTRGQLRDIQRRVERALDRHSASIFDAHLLVVDDRAFIEEVIRGVQSRHVNVEAVLHEVAQRYADTLSQMDDEYLRERAADVRDVARRILMNLAGHPLSDLSGLTEPCVIVAPDLSPSDTATMSRERVLALITDLGSPTSHTAIMARAFEIPAVVGLRNASQRISNGDALLVDGQVGRVIVRPSAATRERYSRIARARETVRDRLETLRDLPARTRDGYEVVLSANIELPRDVDAALRHGARGIGLFRSEFLYLSRPTLPDEFEQARAYEEVARRVAPAPVIIRTLDIGGDKFASSIQMPNEVNPYLGWRAIRFCLAQPELFRTQLRGILRASAAGNVKIMYPMISNVEEVIQANALLEQAKQELAADGVEFDRDIEVGIMIEVPSAALVAAQLAARVRFFSIGTNDLIQYTLAVDRVNAQVTYLYEPTHPAILRLLQQTIEAARATGIWTGVCGEMGGQATLAPLLVGLGVDELSMSPAVIPLVKAVIRSVSYSECESLAARALELERGSDVLALCRTLTEQRCPEIVEYLG